jgi:hypothetical protein
MSYQAIMAESDDNAPQREEQHVDDPSQSKSHCPQQEQSAYVHHQGHDGAALKIAQAGARVCMRVCLRVCIKPAKS